MTLYRYRSPRRPRVQKKPFAAALHRPRDRVVLRTGARRGPGASLRHAVEGNKRSGSPQPARNRRHHRRANRSPSDALAEAYAPKSKIELSGPGPTPSLAALPCRRADQLAGGESREVRIPGRHVNLRLDERRRQLDAVRRADHRRHATTQCGDSPSQSRLRRKRGRDHSSSRVPRMVRQHTLHRSVLRRVLTASGDTGSR
jgi:hypothetical protein